MKWEPKDVIALSAVLGSILLMAMGHNHIVTNVFAAVILVYIGYDINIRRKTKHGELERSNRDRRDGTDR